MIGLGVSAYFHLGWNIYDFLVTLLAIIGIIAERFSSSFFYVVILRPLRWDAVGDIEETKIRMGLKKCGLELEILSDFIVIHIIVFFLMQIGIMIYDIMYIVWWYIQIQNILKSHMQYCWKYIGKDYAFLLYEQMYGKYTLYRRSGILYICTYKCYSSISLPPLGF